MVGFPLGGDVLNLKAQALERFVDLLARQVLQMASPVMPGGSSTGCS